MWPLYSSKPTMQTLIYHLRSIWLFTLSDIKTIIGPKTMFGILNASAAPVFGISPTRTDPQIIRRFSIVVLWTWVNLLPFAIDNQRQPAAVAEDSLNKPWRPMPSRRMTPRQAQWIMASLYPVAVVVSNYVGGLKQCVLLIFLGLWYNDFGGADTSFVIRNFINACGFCCYSSGAMEVALGSPIPWTPRLICWFFLISGIVFSTVQIQDLHDQDGDKVRDRKTVPLVLGDAQARWITAFSMTVWCSMGPWFWGLHWTVYMVSSGFGCLIVLRLLTRRAVKHDRTTFRLWNMWIVLTYSLPFIKHVSHH